MFTTRTSPRRPFQRFLNRSSLSSSLLTLTTLLLTACGGSSDGDGEFFGAGNVSLSLSPSTIDVGDQTRVRIRLSEINEDGALLKIRFPDGLRYVPNSSFLKLEGQDENEFAPDINSSTDGDVYLVYFLGNDELENEDTGELVFELEGLSSVEEGRVEIDIDVDDLDIPNNVEFNIEEPEFQEEDSSQIDVES